MFPAFGRAAPLPQHHIDGFADPFNDPVFSRGVAQRLQHRGEHFDIQTQVPFFQVKLHQINPVHPAFIRRCLSGIRVLRRTSNPHDVIGSRLNPEINRFSARARFGNHVGIFPVTGQKD